MPVTAIYAAIIAVLAVALAARIVPLRRRHRIGLGDGGNRELTRAIRIHANLVEHAPLALILMAACELNDGPTWLLHALGLSLIAGRGLHILGLSRSIGISFGRTAGMALTWSVMLFGALAAVILALAR